MGQPVDDVTEVGGDGLDRLEREGLLEHRQPATEATVGLAEAFVAPGDGRGQGSLPFGHVGCRGPQQLEAGPNAVAKPVHPDETQPGRGELECERHPVQQPADLGQPLLTTTQVELGVGLPGDPREELDSGAGHDLGGRGPDRGHVERADSHDLLAREPQRHPGGDQQAQAGDLLEQPGDGARPVDARVDVVQHHQRPRAVGGGLGVRLADDHGHRGHHVVGRLGPADLDEGDVPAVHVAEPGGHHHGDPRLAGAAHPRQGDEAGTGLPQLQTDPRDQLVTAERRRAGHGQPGGGAGRCAITAGAVVRGILQEDRGLEALEGLTWLDAELVG